MPRELRLALMSLCGLIVALSATEVGTILRGEASDTIAWVSFRLFLLVVAIALWSAARWARVLVVGALWLIAIILPIAVINPFYAMDMPPPQLSVWDMLAGVYPWVAVSLLYLHILGKYRTSFRSGLFGRG